MELHTVQHIDISNAITSVISTDEISAHAFFRQDEVEVRGINYVTVESTAKPPSLQLASDRIRNGTMSIKARPLFPGSLLSSEICVYLDFPEGSLLPTRALLEKWQLDSGTLDSPFETNLYYRLHAPLPGYLANHPYQSESSLNCVALINHRDSLRQIDTIIARSLNNKLMNPRSSKSSRKKTPIRLYLETDTAMQQEQPTVPASYHQFKAELLEHTCHRLSIIGKAGLVMCDTAGIAVDAIRGSVPAAFIASIPEGFDDIQACVLDFLQHGDREQLIADQKAALRQMQDSLSTECHLLSNHLTLRALLTASIQTQTTVPDFEKIYASLISVKESATNTDADENHNLVLKTQQTFCSASSKSVRFKSGLASSRRKFQKFKESPSRFMEDSQIRVLRSLVNSRS